MTASVTTSVPPSAGSFSRRNGSSANPWTISAKELHRYLLKAYRLENRLRRRFIDGLFAMAESKLFLKLGCSSVFQYAEKYFGYGRTQKVHRGARRGSGW